MAKESTDVVIFVALSDELQGIRRHPPFSGSKSFQGSGSRRFYFDFIDRAGEQRSGMMFYIADMAEKARDAVAEVAQKVNTKLVVSVGISAGLSKDVGLGDVVLATSTQNVTTKSKVKDSVEGDGMEIILGGGQIHDHSELAKVLEGVWIGQDQLHSAFSSRAAARADRYLIQLDGKQRQAFQAALDGRPQKTARIVFGPVSSGSILSASERLKKKILQVNRKLLAYDMESGDVADVAKRDFGNAQYIAIRSISDLGDGAKGELEEATMGAARALAVDNVADALSVLLQKAMDFRKKKRGPQPAPHLPPRKVQNTPKPKRPTPGSFIPDGPVDLELWENRYAPLAFATIDEAWREAPILKLSETVAADAAAARVILHGDAGCGKSTLLRLAERLALQADKERFTLHIGLDQLRSQPSTSFADNVLESWVRQCAAKERPIILVDDASTDPISTGAIQKLAAAADGGVLIVAAKDRGGESAIRHFNVGWDHVVSLSAIPIGEARAERFAQSFDWIKSQLGYEAARFENVLRQLEKLGFTHVDALLYSVCVEYRRDQRFTSAQNATKFCEAWAGEFLSAHMRADTTISLDECCAYLCHDHTGDAPARSPRERELIDKLATFHPAIKYSLIGVHCFSLVERAPKLLSDANKQFAPLRRVYDTSVTRAVRHCLESCQSPDEALRGMQKLIELHNVLYLPLVAYLLGRFSERSGMQGRAKQELHKLAAEVRRDGFDAWEGAENAKAKRLAQRAVYISLAYLDDQGAAEEYSRQILENDDDASLNRGFHLEYYRDRLVSAKDGFEAFLIEDDCSTGWVSTQRTLEANLMKKAPALTARGIVELATYCSFAASRLERSTLSAPERQRILDFLDRVRPFQGAPAHLSAAVAVLRASLSAGQERFGAISATRLFFLLKAETRAGWRTRGFPADMLGGRETVASHIFGAMLLAYLLLPECEPDAVERYNRARVIELLLLHDLGESVIGDRIPSEVAADPDGESRANQRLSLLSIFRHMPYASRIASKVDEFESKRTLDGRIAREFDCFDALVQGYMYRRHFPSDENFQAFVASYRERITTQVGRKILKTIEEEVSYWPHDLDWPAEASAIAKTLKAIDAGMY